ncbi:MarR family transcriptional regulator [Streptomyces sp. NPDC001793]|uniref:MarR family transcriptional regulator n=1 Tax=Streptomyces sp. NPDC001793 TaxID=3154657 RepID=UPI00332218EB
MNAKPEPDGIASDLLASIGMLVRRVHQVPLQHGPSRPGGSALSRLDHSGPTTSSVPAREAQITAQAVGATPSALRARGLVERHPEAELKQLTTAVPLLERLAQRI